MTIEPIRHLVVLCHPRSGSFNHQIAATYSETVQACGQVVCVRDLYALRFDPILEYIGEGPQLATLDDLREIRRCDVLTFIYPIWFGLPPAMIKGYVDRVLGGGFKPDSEHPRVGKPLLAGVRMLGITTSASTEAWLAEHGQLIALREGFDRYLGTIFNMADTRHLHIDAIVEGLDKHYAEEQLERVRETARQICADALHAAHRDEMSRVLSHGRAAPQAPPPVPEHPPA
ncbi:NAD(P)H-dependent oxidoreductase [Sphingomonas sp. NFR15]|uniref:NAD(P)H-dependent oxidoreductase n=1 Tax=Sphingomonas sp. NFR15 TaxID=1566282 RepID=UPI00087E7458|nr:NAD(P)H-dependent oxidoreductase [Sphingomonas sp. NFR15]SDA16534.1 NAD(P)H dehydrogenase (quinone) [Sphingomonas sp. NFR15]